MDYFCKRSIIGKFILDWGTIRQYTILIKLYIYKILKFIILIIVNLETNNLI
jgi:hypothetical protein